MIGTEKCKILMLGESAVGKTSLFRRFAGNPQDKPTPTIGAEYKQKVVQLENGQTMKIQLWDTAGTERYRTISSIHYRNLDGALLVFDITDASSFTRLDYWLGELKQKGENVQLILVGNKNDQEESREVSQEQAEEKARSLGVDYMEASSLSQQIVQKMFMGLVEKIVQARERVLPGQMTELKSKGSLQSLRVTDMGKRRSKEESDCC